VNVSAFRNPEGRQVAHAQLVGRAKLDDVRLKTALFVD